MSSSLEMTLEWIMKNVYVLEGEVVGNGNIDINGSVKGGHT